MIFAMDLKRLRTFVAVADSGTVSAAAELLRITQPALSRQIKDLQAEFGVALFDRVGRRLRLTAEGAELVGISRMLLGQADALLEYARSLSRGDIGELSVGATAHTIATVFPAFLRDFNARYPRVHVRTVEAGGIDQRELVRRGALHAAIAVLEGNEDEFIVHGPLTLRFFVAFNPRWKRLPATRMEIRDLAGLPLLLLKPGFGTRKVFDAACRLERMTPAIFMESASPATLLALARERHGVAIVPATVRVDQRPLQLRHLYLRGAPLTADIGVIWKREGRLPPYAGQFSTILAAHLRKLLSRARAE
jgi:LysR family cyn operon transcriptional activator